jgi:DNA-binding SARP family transcriptional activator
MLDVKLFGRAGASYAGKKIPNLFHQLPGQILGYLLLNRDHSHSREHLAAIFWSDASIQAAKKALRNALWRLRQSLLLAGVPVGDYVLLDEEGAAFVTTSCYSLDVQTFEDLVMPTKDLLASDLLPSQINGLERAASLYRGDLLEGIYDDWCLYDRERLRLMYVGSLDTLMVYYGSHREYEHAIECGDHLLLLDNTLEKIHRRMMLLYWMQGDRKSALTQYKLCYQIIRDELGSNPMQETQRLYRQMLYDQLDLGSWSDILGSAASVQLHVQLSPSEDPLCRRIQRELRRLQETIEDAQTASRSIEQLVGEALKK